MAWHEQLPGLRQQVEALRDPLRPEDAVPEAERLALDLGGVSRWQLARLDGRGAISTQRDVLEDVARQDSLEIRRTA